MATTWNANASAQVLASLASPPTLNSGCDESEIRYSYAKLTVAAASGNATANLLRLPAGKIKIFPTLSVANLPDAGSSGTLSIGLGAYVNAAGSTVSADVDALLTATNVGTGPIRTAMLGTVTNSEFCIDLETQSGVYVTTTSATADVGANEILEILVAWAPQG